VISPLAEGRTSCVSLRLSGPRGGNGLRPGASVSGRCDGPATSRESAIRETPVRPVGGHWIDVDRRANQIDDAAATAPFTAHPLAMQRASVPVQADPQAAIRETFQLGHVQRHRTDGGRNRARGFTHRVSVLAPPNEEYPPGVA
jgi:hypothetical protein